jgi:hypothetical protein
MDEEYVVAVAWGQLALTAVGSAVTLSSKWFRAAE